MTTKEILERLSLIADQFVGLGIDPWNLPVRVLLKRHGVGEEYNVLCLSNKLYNRIIIKKGDTLMTFKEFIVHMMAEPEEYYWYVHDVLTPPNSSNVRIMSINGYYGTNGNEVCIAAEEGGGIK